MSLFKACCESPELVDAILSCVQHVVIVVDEKGQIELANNMVSRVFGYSHEELQGKAMSILFTSEDLPYLYPNLLYMAAKGKGFEGEVAMVRKDGTRFFAHLVFRPYARTEQDVSLIIACIHDLEKKTGSDTASSHTHYDDLVKIADGIAHELRNPLVIIGGNAKRLYDVSAGTPDEKRYYESIENTVHRLEGLVQKVEYFTHLPKPTMNKLSIRRLMQEALQPYLQLMREQQIQLTNTMEDRELYVDRKLVVRAFSILLDNAIDALPDGGQLHMDSETKEKNCTVTVTDDGAGILPEDLPYIFYPFYRTKPTGVGIDLAVVRQIMTSHGGHIDVRSQRDSGTTFLLTFPVERRRSIRISRMEME